VLLKAPPTALFFLDHRLNRTSLLRSVGLFEISEPFVRCFPHSLFFLQIKRHWVFRQAVLIPEINFPPRSPFHLCQKYSLCAETWSQFRASFRVLLYLSHCPNTPLYFLEPSHCRFHPNRRSTVLSRPEAGLTPPHTPDLPCMRFA